MKNLDNGNLTANQITALQELVDDQGATGGAWVIKEKLRWIQKAPTPRAAWWRITNTLKVMREAGTSQALLTPMAKALTTLERHAGQVVRRWTSGLTNARLEGMNGLFQAARSRVMAGMYNRIKVIKRVTYRYRDTVCLFLKIRAEFPAKCDKP